MKEKFVRPWSRPGKCVGRKQVYELKPSEQAVFDKQTEAVKVAAVDTELFVGWKDGRLVFDNCSLERILKDLGRWYSFEVFYATSAAKEIPFFFEYPEA